MGIEILLRRTGLRSRKMVICLFAAGNFWVKFGFGITFDPFSRWVRRCREREAHVHSKDKSTGFLLCLLKSDGEVQLMNQYRGLGTVKNRYVLRRPVRL